MASMVSEGVGQGNHAHFHRRYIEIAEDGIDLPCDDGGWDIVHRAHRAGVLHGHSGNDARTIDAERRECLEVGLNASSATTIGTGNSHAYGHECRTAV